MTRKSLKRRRAVRGRLISMRAQSACVGEEKALTASAGLPLRFVLYQVRVISAYICRKLPGNIQERERKDIEEKQ